MIPLIYHYVFLLKMTQLTTSSWRIIEGDLLCWRKKLSSAECEKVLGSHSVKQNSHPSVGLCSRWEEKPCQGHTWLT